MSKKVFILIGGIVGVVVLALGIWWNINTGKNVRFLMESEVAGREIRVRDRFKLNWYLKKMGLVKGVMMPIVGEFLDRPSKIVPVERVVVVFTNQTQELMPVYLKEGGIISSYGQEYDGEKKQMRVMVYVNTEMGGEMEVAQTFERAMLTSLFDLVNYYPKMKAVERQEKMNDFWGQYREAEKKMPAVVEMEKRRSFRIVRETYAASGVCFGSVECGNNVFDPESERIICISDGTSAKNCSGDSSASCNYGGCAAQKCALGACSWCTYTVKTCGECTETCGGGTRVCNDGCGDYTENCNTFPCCTVTKPAVPGVVSPVAPFTEKSGTVTLRWSAVSSWGEECSGTGTRRYEICVGPNSSDPCTGGVNIIASGEASVSATVTGLTSAINYWKIRSINKGGGTSDWSSMNNFCFWGSNSLRPLAVTDWSACDGVSHSRNRSCVAGCDCGGVDLAEVCETEVRGTIFDASFRAVCPGADVNGYLTGLSAEEYAGGAQFALVDGDNSPPTGWSGRLGATTVSTGNYSLNVYGLADYTFDFSDLAGGFDISAGPKLVCNGGSVTALGSDPLCLVQPCELVRNMSFGFNRIYGGWWQTRGGSVYAKNGVQSVIPGTFPGEQRLLLEGADGRRGALLYGNKIDNQLGNNPNARVSNWLWEKLGAYDGARYDYDFYKSRMSVFVMTPWDGDSEDIAYDGSGNDAARGYKILKRDADSVVNLAGSVPAGEKYILLVNGDVRVTSDVMVEKGGFFGVVAKGEIEMASNVARAEGFYVGNVISVPCHDVGGDGCDRDDIQFVGEGSFVGWTGINLSRDMEMGNNTASAEYFVYREDLAENAPAPMKVYSRRFLPFVP